MPDPAPLIAHAILRAPVDVPLADRIVLNFDERMLRRRRLVSSGGLAFVVDLPETVSLDQGDAFDLGDGRLIGVVAAPEALMEVRGELPRLAWHIGNRHAPCQIEADRIVILQDRVLRQMLAGLGALVSDVTGPLRPEGGAYGLGRTLGHSHDARGSSGHHHDHDHDHGSLPPHSHDHQH